MPDRLHRSCARPGRYSVTKPGGALGIPHVPFRGNFTITTLGQLTKYRYEPVFLTSAVHKVSGAWRLSHLRQTPHPAFGPSHALARDVGINSASIIRRNKMLGLGLVGTIIVIALIVWLVRRVV